MMNVKRAMRITLGVCLGVAVVIHGTKLIIKLKGRPKYTLPPGPRPWPIFGNILQLGSSPTNMLAKLCNQYGGLMTLFVGHTPTIIISSPEVLAEFVAPWITPDHFEYKPGELLHGRAMSGYCRYMNVPSHKCPQWRKLRRVLSSYLMNVPHGTTFRPNKQTNRQKVLKALVENIKIEAFADSCYVVTMRPHLRYGCLNLLFAICFGNVVDSATGLVDHQLMQLLSRFKDVIRLGTTCKFSDYLPVVKQLQPTAVDLELAECARRAEEFCIRTVAQVRQRFTPTDPKRSRLLHSFLDVLANLKGEELLSDREITWILTEIMLSTVDQTATLVEWALGNLIYRHDMQTTIHEEIDRVVGPTRDITDEDIDKMPYIRAVIKETQRVNHPVLLTLPHVFTKEFEVGRYTLPAGTRMVAIISDLFSNPNLWIEPNDFRPERFLNDRDAHDKIQDIKQHQLRADVFQAVKRFCPGHSLVTHKAHLFLAKILQSFDVCAAHRGKPNPFDETSSHESGVINMLKVPLSASLKPRVHPLNSFNP